MLLPVVRRDLELVRPDRACRPGRSRRCAVSVQVVVGTAVAVERDLPVPLVAPNPVPVDRERAAAVDVRAGHREQLRACAASSGQVTCVEAGRCPGDSIVTPTWVGARSVGMVSPGNASNSVAIVR